MTADAKHELFERCRTSFKEVPKDHKFSEGWDPFADVILVVEDYRFHVHKAYLSVNSPVFRTMLSSNFKEASSAEIPLPEKKPLPVYQMLAFFYSGVTEDIKEKEPLDTVGLLALAREYQVMHLTKRCEESLVEQCQSSVPTVDALLLSQEYELTRLLSQCITHMTGKYQFRTIEEHARFSELSEENQKKLIKEHIRQLESKCDLPYKYRRW